MNIRCAEFKNRFLNLLESKINMEASEKLFYAIQQNDLEFLKAFLPYLDCPEAVNEKGHNLLHSAVLNDKLEIVIFLIENTEISIDNTCEDGKSALFYACDTENSNLDLVNILLYSGANVNLENEDGVVPIHCACRHGNIALVKILLVNNASLLTIDSNGYTCLHYTAISNSLEMLAFLLTFDIGLDINSVDLEGCTPLMLAVDVANIEIANKLLEIGADVNIYSPDNTALHLAVINQEKDMFKSIWDLMDFNIIRQLSSRNNLVKLMIKYGWFFSDKVDILFEVLDHENIMDILGPEVKIFTIFFYRLRFVKYLDETNVINIVNKFIKTGVIVSQNDLRIFLLNFYKFKNKFDILNVLIIDGNANIDDKNIIKFTIELYPELIPKMMSFCVKNDPLNVLHLFTQILRINKEMIKLLAIMLYYCTPNYTLKQMLSNHLTNLCYALIACGESDTELPTLYNYIIDNLKSVKVPSLLELSRDQVRKTMASNIDGSRDYTLFFNNFEMSKEYIKIIKCEIAVNILNDFE